jgi:peptide deformylase
MNLVSSDAEVLHTPAAAFDFANPPTDPSQLARDLFETMLEHKESSLSAPQCGIPYRVLVISANPGLACFNPRIVDVSSEQILLEERCATFPHLFLSVKRPRRIKVRYTQANGETLTQVFDGLTSRLFQHEVDHLNGILYTNKANKVHLERALRKKKELDRMVKNAGAKGIA